MGSQLLRVLQEAGQAQREGVSASGAGAHRAPPGRREAILRRAAAIPSAAVTDAPRARAAALAASRTAASGQRRSLRTAPLLVLAGGEIRWDHECDDCDRTRTSVLPPALFGAYQQEPLWVDLRKAHTAGRTSLRDPVFQDRVADLAAPLHGCAKDELVSEELRQQRTWARVRNTAVTAMALVTAVAVTASFLFVSQRDEARHQAALANQECGIRYWIPSSTWT